MKYLLRVSVLLLTVLLVAGCVGNAPTETSSEGQSVIQPVVNQPAAQNEAPSQEEADEPVSISAELTLINAAMENSIASMDLAFFFFGEDYSISALNQGMILNSQVKAMEETKQDIADDVKRLEGKELDFNALMNTVDEATLSEEENVLVTSIESKITKFNAEKTQTESCLEGMGEYVELIRFLQGYTSLNEAFASESNKLSLYLNAKEYDNARDQVTKSQEILKDLKVNVESRNTLGIQGNLSSSLDAVNLFIEAYDLYPGFIDAIEDERQSKIDSTGTELLSKIAEASAAEDPNISTYMVGQADQWYSENIGVCA